MDNLDIAALQTKINMTMSTVFMQGFETQRTRFALAGISKCPTNLPARTLYSFTLVRTDNLLCSKMM
jgi:hypothetical protein